LQGGGQIRVIEGHIQHLLSESARERQLVTTSKGGTESLNKTQPHSFLKKMNENSWASAILAEPSCAVEDNKLLSAECVKVKGHERL
jgi:hypothetical protein